MTDNLILRNEISIREVLLNQRRERFIRIWKTRFCCRETRKTFSFGLIFIISNATANNEMSFCIIYEQLLHSVTRVSRKAENLLTMKIVEKENFELRDFLIRNFSLKRFCASISLSLFLNHAVNIYTKIFIPNHFRRNVI